jgi:putative transposase
MPFVSETILDGYRSDQTVPETMSWDWLGVKPPYLRARVNDDNACAASLFRTADYRPKFSDKGLADLDAARSWASGFVHWYNIDQRHSGIRCVAPAQR